MSDIEITSDFAVLSVKNGRAKLAKHFAGMPRSGKPLMDEREKRRIPITITGYIEDIWGHDDGIDQEFEVSVTSLATKGPRA